MTPFDLNQFQSDERRNYLENLLKRGEEAFDSIKAAYAPHNDTRLEMCYVNQQTLNAYASQTNDRYLVEIEISCPLLIDALLKKILSDPNVLPELPVDERSLMEWKLPFTEGIDNIELEKSLEIKLDDHRFHISRALADFCMMFILFHEIGHVCCGHTSGSRFYFKEERYSEYLGLEKWFRRGTFLRRAWEIDADMFAGFLLCQTFDAFLGTKQASSLTKAFAFINGNRSTLVGLVLAALSSVFIYLSQKNYQIHNLNSHPSPALRSKAVGNSVIANISKDKGIPKEALIESRIDYMAQFFTTMEDIGILDWDKFDAQFADSDKLLSRDYLIQRRFRKSCQRWSIVPVSLWGQD